MPRAASRQMATSAAHCGPRVLRSFRRPARMRVFAVPSGSPSSAATCSCVRSSRKARLSASRCACGSSSSADLRTVRRCRSHVASTGPRSLAGWPASRSPSGSGTTSGWRLRRRSSFRRRKCVICRIHARTVPRSGSNRRALRQTARKTSCTRSSAAARSSDWTARPKINRAKRRWSSPSASAEPSATCRMSSSSRGARSVDGIRRCPFMQAYIAAAWWCEVAAPQARRSTAPSVTVTTPAEAIWIGSAAADAGPTKRTQGRRRGGAEALRDGRRASSPPEPNVHPQQRAKGCAAGERRVKGSYVHPTHGFANQGFHSRLWTVGGDRARVGPGQPTSQARVLRKLGPQPLEHGMAFGLTSERVERVGREPAAAETQPWLVRRGHEPFEDREGTRGVVPILEQRFRSPHLDRGIAREALRGKLEKARRVPGTACLFVELGLPKEAREEEPGDVLGIATADAHASGVPVHELPAELAGLEDAEEREQAETGGHERHRPDD